MNKQTIAAVTIGLCLVIHAYGAEPVPWWKQQKIRYFWGMWGNYNKSDVPMERAVEWAAKAGATVFVEHGAVRPVVERARIAHKHGMRYFVVRYAAELREIAEKMDPPPVFANSRGSKELSDPCPAHPAAYEKWFVDAVVEDARTGLVDGVHFDMEPYGGRSEADLKNSGNACFSKFIFDQFVAEHGKGPGGLKPAEYQRSYEWMDKHGLLADYIGFYERKRFEMWRSFRDRIHAVRPDFTFAVYLGWETSMNLGLHSKSSPVFATTRSASGSRTWVRPSTSLVPPTPPESAKQLGARSLTGTDPPSRDG